MLALAGGIALVVSLVYRPVLSARALAFDDHQYLVENAAIKHPSWASARRFFIEITAPSTVEGYYQPLTMVSLMLDCAAGGGPSFLRPFRRTSLMLHVANTLLVFGLLQALFGAPWAAAVLALGFGLHPLTVESTAWLSQRKTVLATCFSLASLLTAVSYSRRPHWLRLAASWLLYVLALLAKPTSVPLPALLLILDWWPLARLSRRAVMEKIPFFAAGGAAAVITLVSQASTAGASVPAAAAPEFLPLLLAHNMFFYLVKVVYPRDLAVYYPFPEPFTLSQPAILAGVLGSVVLLIGLAASLRWTRSALAGWLFFTVALLPSMSGIGFTEVVAADRFVYLPAVGLLFSLAALVQWSLRSWRTRSRTAVLGMLAVAVLLAQARATRAQLAHWQDSVQLTRRALSLAPAAGRVHHFHGTALLEAGDPAGALTHYREALRLGPQTPELQYDLGLALLLRGQSEEAMGRFRAAIETKANFPAAHYNLGIALVERGDTQDGLAHLRRAVALKPEFAEAHHGLGNVLADQGQLDVAIAHLRTAVELEPGFAAAHNDLGALLERRGDLSDALRHFSEALRLQPDLALARDNQARVAARLRQPPTR
ncbi:MAG: tetratricopeptide repeat protein [Deltaproteobacteria bacterium]|nr:tetratricopeptide repeat protein [Deltaproteobacteria bacterium]